MTITRRRINGRWVREYFCHGFTWQLMLSTLFPQRYTFFPRCPTCLGEWPAWMLAKAGA